MKKIKIKKDIVQITDFLSEKYNSNIEDVIPLHGGERSKAYSFLFQKEEFIIRTNKDDCGFEKDKYAYTNFSLHLPIPRIISIGQFQDRYYAISEKIQGKSIQSSEDIRSSDLLNNIIFTLYKIYQIKIPNNSKFGILDKNGKTYFNSWKEWVLKDYVTVKKDDGNYFTWEELYKKKFIDKKIIQEVRDNITRVLAFVPTERYLIHGDFGTGNIMINNEYVTGVIDWNESSYGDFIYDVAWFDFWISKTNFIEEYKKFFKKNGISIPHIKERINLHQLSIGLQTLGIYAAINYKDGYNSTLHKIRQIASFK